MNWDRRAFVKFAVGAVIGIHASPLVPKLMDDTAIWTQNWNWVPNPEGGAQAFASTVNPGTATAAQVRIINSRIAGERLIRVESNDQVPQMGEGVVPADISSLQYLYNQEVRVEAPLLRDRATGRLSTMSWEEALDMVAGRLADLFRQGKAHTVVAFGENAGNTTGSLLTAFMYALGSPNLAFRSSADQTLAMAGQLMMGQADIGFDLMNSDMVLSFGTPLLEGWGAPVATRHAFTTWKDKGGKLVSVEPRCTVTASSANQWLGCMPGTEGAVALALAAIMIEEGWSSSQAADGFGFADTEYGPGFKTFVTKNYNRELVAQLSGVPAAKLVATAKAFAHSKAGVAVCGPGNGGDPGRLFDFMSVLALNAVKGNLGKKGGVVVRAKQPVAKAAEVMRPDKPSLTGDGGPLGVYSAQDLAARALAGDPYAPQMVLFAGGNPVFGGPAPRAWAEIAAKAPFVVAITPYMDETAATADLVLPAAHWLECWGDCPTPFGAAQAFYGLHKPLVAAVPGAKATGDILLALAKRLGGEVAKALPYEDMRAALAAAAKDLGDFDKLAEKSFWMQEKVAYGDLSYQTPSGKLEFFSLNLHNAVVRKAGTPGGLARALEEMDIAGGPQAAFLPHWEIPVALALRSKSYPLVLMAAPSLRTSWGPDPITPYMIKSLPETVLADKDLIVVEMNPETAHALHLYEGDVVKVESPAGGAKAKLHLFAGMAPGLVTMPVGLGHTKFGFQVAGKGENFFRVVELASDPMSGLPSWELTRVNVKIAKGVDNVGS